MKISLYTLLLLFFLSGCETRKLKEEAILQLHKESEMVLMMHSKVYTNYIKKIEAFKSMLKRISFMHGTEKLLSRLDTLEKKMSEVGIQHGLKSLKKSKKQKTLMKDMIKNWREAKN